MRAVPRHFFIHGGRTPKVLNACPTFFHRLAQSLGLLLKLQVTCRRSSRRAQLICRDAEEAKELRVKNDSAEGSQQ